MANDSYDNLTKDMQPILQNLEDKVSNLSQKVKAFSGSDEAAVEDDLIEQIINYLREKKANIAAIVDNATFQEALEQFEVATKQYETAIETYKLKMCAQYGHYNITTVEQSVSTNEHTYYGNIHKFELVETCKYCGLKRRYTYTGTLGNIPGSRIASQEEHARDISTTGRNL